MGLALHKHHFQLVKCHNAAVCRSDDCFISCVTALVNRIVGLLKSVLTNEDIQTSTLMGTCGQFRPTSFMHGEGTASSTVIVSRLLETKALPKTIPVKHEESKCVYSNTTWRTILLCNYLYQNTVSACYDIGLLYILIDCGVTWYYRANVKCIFEKSVKQIIK